MDSNNLPNNNYSPNSEENNENQRNDYQNNWNPENTYQNNGYQNNGYQNNGYQNDYMNNQYQNSYQNSGYSNNEYQNGYQNGYTNNNTNSNTISNTISTYINSDNLSKTYKNVQQKAINFVNTTLADDHKKRIAIIIVVVLAVIVFGSLITGAFGKHNSCSAEKSANIEEYLKCHPSELEDYNNRMRDDSVFVATIEPKGDQLNLTMKFRDHVSDEDVSLLRDQVASSENDFSKVFPSAEEIKSKVISPIRLHYVLLNDDGSFITDKDYIAN